MFHTTYSIVLILNLCTLRLRQSRPEFLRGTSGAQSLEIFVIVSDKQQGKPMVVFFNGIIGSTLQP
jgi:hypothetical protein